MQITLSKIKSHSSLSEETECFSAEILANGELAGSVENDGRGGCNSYFWSNPELGRQVEEWAEQQPTEYDFEKLDQIIGKLLSIALVEKQMRRWLKTKTCFRLQGDEPGTWRQIKADPRSVDYIKGKYGNQITFILTAENLTEAINAWKGLTNDTRPTNTQGRRCIQ